MAAFIVEAKRLLEEDIPKGPSLPTLQGLMFLYLTVSLCGEDRLGYGYMLQAIDMAEELSNADSASGNSSSGNEIESRTSKAMDVAIWGVFEKTTASHLGFMRPQIMKVPVRQKPRAPFALYGSATWTPYPRHGSGVSAYVDELVEVSCDVSMIGSRLTQSMFATDPLPRLALEVEIKRLYEQLVSTLAAMSEHLQVREGATVSVLTHQ